MPAISKKSKVKVSRSQIEENIDNLITENRFTIAVLFPLFGCLMMVLSSEWSNLPQILRFNPALILFGVLIMRLPLASGLLPLINKKSAFLIVLLTVYTYVIEIIGVSTGFPYGEFEYGVSLGPMFFDVPIALPLFFIPLVFNSYLLSILLFDFTDRRILRIPAVVLIVILIDMILDPAAVSLGLWSYSQGIYYGVPIQNYAGWILSATVATVLIDASFDFSELKSRVQDCEYFLDDMVSFSLMWGLINLYYLSVIPAIITLVFVVSLIRTEKFNFVI